MRYLVSHFTQTLVSALSSMGRWWVDPVKSSPTKYNLLSYSIIHLLHSDQFVLINPHKGSVSETKAPGKQWTTPPHPSLRLHPHRCPSSAPLPSTLWPLVAWKVPVYEQETERDEKRGIPEKRGAGGSEGVRREKYPCPREEWNIFWKNTMRRLLLYSGHSINQRWSKSWHEIQSAAAKKRKGLTVICKDVRKLSFFLPFCLTHLLQLWLKNTALKRVLYQ